MKPKLYVIHGSHPCAAVERAADLKGIEYDRVELAPPVHAVITKALGFPARTVPAMKLGSEKLSGSGAILRRLEELAPEPPLFPADAAARAAVEEAERFDDEVMQPLVRRVMWTAVKARPKALASFSEHSRLKPSLPPAVVGAVAPVIARVELKLNPAGDEAIRADLASLDDHMTQLDGWLADGTLGTDPPNAADLKLAGSVRLLANVADLAPVLNAHPYTARAREIYPLYDGSIPTGALPAAYLSAPATRRTQPSAGSASSA